MRVKRAGIVVAVLVILLSPPALLAYEIHAIDVVARIESPLVVNPPYIDLDLNQEKPSETFTVSLSDSFRAQRRLERVDYRIGFKLRSLDSQTDAGDTSFLICRRSLEENLEPLDEVEAASLNRSSKDVSDNWLIYTESFGIEGELNQEPGYTDERYRIHIKVEIVGYGRLARRAAEL